MSKMPLLALSSIEDLDKVIDKIVQEYGERPGDAKRDYTIHVVTGKIVKVPLKKGYKILVMTKREVHDLWKYISSSYYGSYSKSEIVITEGPPKRDEILKKVGRNAEFGPNVLIAHKWEGKFKIGKGGGKIVLEDGGRLLSVNLFLVEKDEAERIALQSAQSTKEGVKVRRSWDGIISPSFASRSRREAHLGRCKYISLSKSNHCIYVETEKIRKVVWVNRLSGRIVKSIDIPSKSDIISLLRSRLNSESFTIERIKIGPEGVEEVNIHVSKYRLKASYSMRGHELILNKIHVNEASARALFRELMNVIPIDVRWSVNGDKLSVEGKTDDGYYQVLVSLENPAKPVLLKVKRENRFLGFLRWIFRRRID